jgi:hypothetical protein
MGMHYENTSRHNPKEKPKQTINKTKSDKDPMQRGLIKTNPTPLLATYRGKDT